ncbi:MAG: HDIG domain-containing protein [Planctomycetes bacterium]|nr:HDIG domain-containing protein [Planctomycetota bacterium]
MAKGNGKVKLRRTQVRRQRSEQSEPLLKRLRAQVGLASPAIGLGFVVLAIGIVLYGPEPFPYYARQEVRGRIDARVKFKIIDKPATLRSKEEARETTPNYFDLNTSLIKRIQGTVTGLYTTAQSYDGYPAYQAAVAEQGDPPNGEPLWRLTEAGFRELYDLVGDQGEAQFTAWVDKLVEDLKRERLVPKVTEEERGVAAKSSKVILSGAVKNEPDDVVPIEEPDSGESATELPQIAVNNVHLDSPEDPKDVDRAAASLSRTFPVAIHSVISDVLVAALREAPLFKFNLEQTRKEMDAAAASRDEIQDIKYRYDEPLAAPPDFADISPRPLLEQKEGGGRIALSNTYHLNESHIELLRYEHDRVRQLLDGNLEEDADAEDRAVATSLRDQHYLQQAGRGALVFMVALGLVTYCGLFQDRVIRNPVRALSLTLLFLIMVAVARAAHLSDIGVMFPYVVVGPVVMTAAILTMVYSQRFAIGMTSGLAVLITIAVRGDLGTLLVLTAAMAVAVYQLREIRSRHELFSTGLLNAMAAFIVGVVVVLLNGYSLDTAIKQGGSAAMASLLAIAIFFLMLAPIERIFKVATNWTLLELLDTSQPLLSRLAREAPGTFAHSLWLSSMAESACEAVGANGLLAKVGAMYHDIGKVHKAEYFAENQEAHINRHDNLSPTMSLLVIVGHVKDGIELAKEERLPRAVVRFIEEHHGTTVVRYFHHIASEKQKAAGSTREVSESEFRYPGPKPQSKETAVLMLCDGVEGAVRALPEPTAGRIENVVHTVLMERLNDGQFDDCDITLKELHRVEESLVKSLCRFYHGRVAYPKPPEPSKPTDPVPVMG